MNYGSLALIWLHVSGNLLWIGAILAVGAVLTGKVGDARTRGETAYALYRRLAIPGFVLSFVFGSVRLLMDPSLYLVKTHWMHGKLPFALAVIALHHVIGARAKRLAQGTVQDPGPAGTLSLVLAVSAVIAAAFAVFKLPS